MGTIFAFLVLNIGDIRITKSFDIPCFTNSGLIVFKNLFSKLLTALTVVRSILTVPGRCLLSAYPKCTLLSSPFLEGRFLARPNPPSVDLTLELPE